MDPRLRWLVWVTGWRTGVLGQVQCLRPGSAPDEEKGYCGVKIHDTAMTDTFPVPTLELLWGCPSGWHTEELKTHFWVMRPTEHVQECSAMSL